MSITEKTRKALREVGLTEYETTAYLHLLTTGPATASQISRPTNLPYSKIYDILTSLEEKGWIETENNRPKKYFPKPPTEALEATKLRIQSALNQNTSQITGELQALYGGKGTQERPDIWILRGEFSILAKIREYFNQAQKELMLAATILPKPLLAYLTQDLTGLRNRGIKIKILVTAQVEAQDLKELAALGEVRVKDQMFGNGVIADSQKVMLLLGKSTNSNEYLAICSDHIGLAELSKEYFEYLWADAKKSSKPAT